MTAKEYLSQYRTLDAEINSKLEQAAQLRALAAKVSPSTGFGSSGGISDRVGKTVAKIVDLENEISKDVDRLVDLKTEIHRTIKLMPDPLFRTVLDRKFILRNSLETIAEKTGYSVPQIKRIYKKAKVEFEKMIPNDTK